MPAESLIPAPVLRLIDAINTGNSGAFLSCFTEDSLIDVRGREFRGEEAIGAWNDAENIGMHSRIDVHGAQTDGEDVVLDVQVSGDGNDTESTYAFTVTGNLVQRMIIRD